MALVSTRTYDWQDLADDSITWGGYTEWTGNGVNINGSTGYANLVHTTDAQDLGVSRDFYCTATAISNGTHSFVVKVSDDDLSYTDKDPTTDTLKGRYVKFEVTVVNGSETASLTSIETEFFFNPIEETFDDFSVGATATTLPIARNYSRILNMNYTIKHDVSSLQKFVVAMTDVTKTAPKVISYDLDTWGKVATATTADITIKGFPTMAVSDGNIVVS